MAGGSAFPRRIRPAVSKKIVAQANLLVFGVLILFITVIGLNTWDRFAAARSARAWTQHTYAAQAAIRELEIPIREAETDERGYVLTGHDDFLTGYNAALPRASARIGDLQRLTADN